MKIIKHVGKNKKVLDVGCSTGYLAERFKKNGCYVVGIELDKEAVKIAKEHCDNVIVGDVEEIVNLPYSKGFFDVIVCADILEHLKRPDIMLSKLKQYLNSKGFVVASIPNVARFDVRLKLLFGKFDYKNGIMAVTHLRFFTLKTAKLLFQGLGYKIMDLDYTGLASKLKFLPTLLAFQFIIIACPTG